jgi:hypothetical protein
MKFTLLAAGLRMPRFFDRAVVLFLALAGLALLDPRLAKAVPLTPADIPGATYINSVTGGIVNDPGSTQHQSTGLPTTGLSVSGSGVGPSGPTSFNASTSNDYSIPQVSASALANAGASSQAQSGVNYFVAFSGNDGTIPVNIQAFGDVNTTGGRAFLQVTLQTLGGVNEFVQTLDILGGSQLLSMNQTFMLDANVLYRAIIDTDAFSFGLNGAVGGAASAHLNLFFAAPDGYSVLTSEGIGNASPVAATPLPAALPLFASGLGALGLFGWRRKKKAAVLAA